MPSDFLERFRRILPSESAADVEKFFACVRPPAVRVNTLKIPVAEAVREFAKRNWEFRAVSWCPEAFIFAAAVRPEILDSDLIKDGRIYVQGLSSLLPAVVLSPTSADRVLDMCAAPGSKATQMAALMRNQGELVCLEAVRPRFYRLKGVAALLGADNMRIHLTDARRFRSVELFDKILLDVPCSSEGRFQISEPESFGYWSPRKIKEMRQKQRGIIMAAGRLLKPGGTMVYSTCTFAPEENEEVVSWFLHKAPGRFRVEPIVIPGLAGYPALRQWENKDFDPRVGDCLRVLPTAEAEGFFLAKIIKD